TRRAKVACQFRIRRYVKELNLGCASDRLTLEGTEEESSILNDRTADIRAILVLDQRWSRQSLPIGEVIISVQNLVTKIIVSGSMKGVGPGFGGQVDDAASIAAVLGADVVGGNAKFLHDVLRRNQSVEVAGNRIRRHSVNKERALVAKTATDGIVAKPNRVRPRTVCLVRCSIAVGAALSNDPWHQREHIVYVASAEGDTLNLLLGDGCSQRSTVGLQGRCFIDDLNGLAHVAHLHGGVNTRCQIDLDLDSVADELLEPGHLHLDLIKAGVEVWKCVGSRGTGLCSSGFIRSQISQLDSRAAHSRAAVIGNRADDAAEPDLGSGLQTQKGCGG